MLTCVFTKRFVDKINDCSFSDKNSYKMPNPTENGKKNEITHNGICKAYPNHNRNQNVHELHYYI